MLEYVKCISPVYMDGNKKYPVTTVGEVYKVLEENHVQFAIIDDEGDEHWFGHFEDDEDTGGWFVPTENTSNNTFQSVNTMVDICYNLSKSAGWWNEGDEQDIHVLGTKIALIHSEVSEALEGLRKDCMDDHLSHRKMIEVELADALIRIFDLAGAMKLDLGGALVEKLEYNATRKDHKKENRDGEGGKKI